ncbi:unnamed protein product [Moneuplotes crassus]|uniref:Protein phosphatase n=1 Tax=Euplotes crassus TaxID=5936 RepID=A0AAD2D260_EUPCR|nr:unnamed protein product [Moneuplotes crassus]
MKLGSFFTPKNICAAGGLLFSTYFYNKYPAYAASFGYLKSGATVKPHPDKEYKGGEDALVIKERMISVEDGVGGWTEAGYDVAKYSKQLMGLISGTYDENPHFTPKEILTEAAKHTTEIGSTTAVIAILDADERTLATTNLGDSSYLLLRHNTHEYPRGNWLKMYRSLEQQHYFDCPYQVGTHGDHPYKANDEVHSVVHNDIIVMATDGVWDNTFDEEVIKVIEDSTTETGNLEDPQKASQKIAEIAFEHSHDENYESPFQVSSAASDKETRYGGKKDDITVIVSQIKLE